MIALFIVINRTELFENLIDKFHENGIYSATIFDSIGMASTYQTESMLTSFRGMLNKFRPFNKTILMLLPTEEEVEKAKNCVREVMGDLERENIGIMFTLPVTSFEGIRRIDS